MSNIDNIRFLRFGGAEKSTFEMSKEELERVSADVLNRAKEKAFSRGLPIYYSRNNKVFAEYATGKVVEVKSSCRSYPLSMTSLVQMQVIQKNKISDLENIEQVRQSCEAITKLQDIIPFQIGKSEIRRLLKLLKTIH